MNNQTSEETTVFVLRRSFLVPLGLLVAMTLALLIICLVQGQPTAKVIILVGLMVPLAGLFIESAGRRIEIGQDRVRAVRPFRARQFPCAEVTALETVKVRKRVFLTLAAGEDDYLIISNAYAHFPQLVQRLADVVPETALTEETRELLADPPVRQNDVFAIWLAVAAMTYILVAQFLN